MREIFLIAPGERPPSYSLAAHLWGARDFDSDGNEDLPIAGGWTELTLTLRPDYDERIDVDPLDEFEPLVLVVRCETPELAHKAAAFLQTMAGGRLSETPPEDRA